MQILVYKDIPNKLGETPMSVVSSSNSKYNQCIPYGDIINGNDISDSLSPYRYSNNYYLWWANKTNSNKNKLINSYQKESRSPSANINGYFYHLYCMANSSNITTDFTGSSNQFRNIWNFNYLETICSGPYSSDINQHTSHYQNQHQFHYSVLGNSLYSPYFFNGFPMDYIGNDGYSYDAYLIYSKPISIRGRKLNSNFTPETKTGDQAIIYNIDINTDIGNGKDYRLDIINDIINDTNVNIPTKLKNALTKFKNFISGSTGYNCVDIIPINEQNDTTHRGISYIESKLYWQKYNITPITNPNITEFCYTSLMYEVLNRLPGDYSITLSSLDEGYKIPPSAGSGTFTINEGTIVVSDFDSSEDTDCFPTSSADYNINGNLVYNTFLYIHTHSKNESFKGDIVRNNISNHFYYVTYFILVKMSRLNILNLSNQHLNLNDQYSKYEHYYWHDFDWTIKQDNTTTTTRLLQTSGNELIPIPLFTIAIDYDSFTLVNTSISRVPGYLLNRTYINRDYFPLHDYFPNMFQQVYQTDSNNNRLYEVSASSSGIIYSSKGFKIIAGNLRIIPQY